MLGPIRDFLNTELFALAGTSVTPARILVATLIVAVAWLVSRGIQRTLRRAFRVGRRPERKGVEVSQRLAHYAVMTVGIAAALHAVGINLAALFAAGAIFAVAVGFAMQNIAQNFVSGLILLFERSIQPGDVLEIDGQVVRVEEMRIRFTVARSRDEEELIIPNSVLVQSSVKNFTLRDSLYRVRARIGVVYGSDMREVRRALEETAAELPWRSTERDPRILLVGFGSSSVDFDVSVWIEDPWDAPQALSALHEAVWWALRDAGVTIAFPQLDVHFDEQVVEAWSGAEASAGRGAEA